MNALILVDLQNDFVPGGALPVPQGDRAAALANRIQPHFDLVLATQDWHPPDHGSFAANHPGAKIGDVIDLDGLPQILWPVHCVQKTPGAAFVPDLDMTRVHRVFQKGADPKIDSYSGFFDNGQRKATGLGEYLNMKGATDVYVLGLATDYCVKFTALDARRLGFNAYLVEDACRGVELRPGDTAHAIEEMKQAGVKLIQSRDIIGE